MTETTRDHIKEIDRMLSNTYLGDMPHNAGRKPMGALDPRRKGHVNLDLHRHGTMFGGPNQRRCSREGCGQPAMREADACRFHVSKGVKSAITRARNAAAAEGATGSVKPKSRSAQARRVITNLLVAGAIPKDLRDHPAFQATWDMAREKSEARRGTQEKYPKDFLLQGSKHKISIVQAGYLLAVELVRAYLVREETGDWKPWTDAIVKIKRSGLM